MKLSDVLGNIPGLAALAIIVAGVGGFAVAMIASLINRPLTPEAIALIDRFINILIGLAVGSGAFGNALYMRSVRVREADELRAKENAEQGANNPKGYIYNNATVPSPPVYRQP